MRRARRQGRPCWAGSSRLEGGTLDAVEPAEHRAELVRRAVDGLPVTVHVADGRTRAAARRRPSTGCWSTRRAPAWAPCAGGPEARWRRRPEDVAELTRLQRELLAAALRHVRPGGVVAYVTCSPHLAETVGVVAAVSRRRGKQAADGGGDRASSSSTPAPYLPDVPDLGPGPAVQLWPHRHGTDAMFLALLRRSG